MKKNKKNIKQIVLILMACLLLLSCDDKQKTPSLNPPQTNKLPNQPDYRKLIIGEWNCVNVGEKYRLLVSSTKQFSPDGKFRSSNYLINKASSGVSVTTGTYIIKGNELTQKSIDKHTKKTQHNIYTIDQLTKHSLKLSDKFDKNNCTK